MKNSNRAPNVECVCVRMRTRVKKSFEQFPLMAQAFFQSELERQVMSNSSSSRGFFTFRYKYENSLFTAQILKTGRISSGAEVVLINKLSSMQLPSNNSSIGVPMKILNFCVNTVSGRQKSFAKKLSGFENNVVFRSACITKISCNQKRIFYQSRCCCYSIANWTLVRCDQTRRSVMFSHYILIFYDIIRNK